LPINHFLNPYLSIFNKILSNKITDNVISHFTLK
jgi:hypothetical protein